MSKYYELKKRPDPLNPPAFQPNKQGPRVTTVYPDVDLSLAEYVLYHRTVNKKTILVTDAS